MSGPQPPDATKTANTAFNYAKKAGIFQNELNQVGQVTPTGSLKYTQNGTNPDGSPRYVATTTLRPRQQNELNAQTGAGTAAANAATGIINSNASQFAAGPDVNETGITKAIMGWGQDYLQPVFDAQNASQTAKLANQGIAPGSEAYTNAMRDTSRNQNDAYTQLLLQGQGQALTAAEAKYNDPLKAIATLSGGSQPNVNYAQTPQAQVQSPDFGQLAQQQYQAQRSNYDSTLSGLFKIPTTLLGGWATGGA